MTVGKVDRVSPTTHPSHELNSLDNGISNEEIRWHRAAGAGTGFN